MFFSLSSYPCCSLPSSHHWLFGLWFRVCFPQNHFVVVYDSVVRFLLSFHGKVAYKNVFTCFAMSFALR